MAALGHTILSWMYTTLRNDSIKDCEVENPLENNRFCYTSQLKNVSWLRENVSRAIGQNSMTP